MTEYFLFILFRGYLSPDTTFYPFKVDKEN